ncbi:MAG TPA: hypothetical protein VKM55_11415 [Candidatus Lokiarchaeia archaeon]|nr:hypothetical protein [Candidatus Lokiarchaeia archaeon]
MSSQNPLKKFNEILAKEIERANAYEKNGMWEQAKKQWLDLIEYCRLFAKKTEGLKPAMQKMILQKADALMERVQRAESKLGQLAGVSQAKPRKDQEEEDEAVVVNVEVPPTDALKPKSKQGKPAAKAVTKSSANIKTDGAQKKFIAVGEEHIEVPDDFPLVEITPAEGAFKPASAPSDKVEIDTTRYPVDEAKLPAKTAKKPAPKPAAKPGPNKPRA